MTRPRALQERGDAGLPILLIAPALLIAVFHLIGATQQLREQREANAVAAAAARVGNQADPASVRLYNEATMDRAGSQAAVRRYVQLEDFQLDELRYEATRGDGTFTVEVTVSKEIDFLFPAPLLKSRVSGSASTVLVRGVTAVGE